MSASQTVTVPVSKHHHVLMYQIHDVGGRWFSSLFHLPAVTYYMKQELHTKFWTDTHEKQFLERSHSTGMLIHFMINSSYHFIRLGRLNVNMNYYYNE